MYLKLAWRNLWRNKRRTLITLASIFFAVILSTFMMSMKEGVYDKMVESMVASFTGYAQIHLNGYWEDKNLDNAFVYSDSLQKDLNGTKGLKAHMPRIENFALAASREVTKGAMVVGVNPEKEITNTSLDKRLVEGEYFRDDDEAVLIGAGLAQHLNMSLGDTLVLLGQGYHGVSAAGKYPIKGIVKYGSPDLSKRLVFLPLKTAQWFYGMENMVSTVVLVPEDPSKTIRLVTSLRNKLGVDYETMTWQEMSPDLINMIETDRMEGYVFMFILYMVISFGIFGTMLMMLAERTREFGVLVAVGMKRIRLSIMVFFEILIISVLGAIIGMFGAFPLCAYFYLNPIELSDEMKKMSEEYGLEAVLQTSIAPEIFIQQAVIIALIACLIAIYPFMKLMRLDALNAMRN